MGLFDAAQMSKINEVAARSKQTALPARSSSAKGINSELAASEALVTEYFKDSKAILIQSKAELHDYIDEVISAGIAGIDTETTGLDKLNDTIVGSSLYYPGGVECYIPNKHLVPIFDQPYKDQLEYSEVQSELDRLVDHNVKLVFANADFDLSMIAKDYRVDLSYICYYDVILAWRCIKEDESDNRLKSLYHKYVLKGAGDPKQFADFFNPELFPYCKPKIAKLYAANDAKITYDLMQWQLPYITKSNPKCQKRHLEAISDLIWNVEFPLMPVCFDLHQRGLAVDSWTATKLKSKYHALYSDELVKLSELVDQLLATSPYALTLKSPFKSGKDFNPNSNIHTRYLLKDLMNLPIGGSVDKNILKSINTPITNQIVKVREIDKLLGTYVDKLPNTVGLDHRVHATFKSIGADTGRFSSKDPNMQNIPSHAEDIRHMFRATPAHTDKLTCVPHQNGYLVELPYWGFVKDNQSNEVEVKDICAKTILQLCSDSAETPVLGQVVEIKDLTATRELHLEINVELSSNDVPQILVRYNSNVMLSSDYSAQEPRLTAFVSNDPIMIKTFQEGKDIYGSIASVAFKLPYENCLEFHPETHEYQPEGKARRSEAKTIVLGICYGRSVPSIGEQLYGKRKDMTVEEKTKEAQKVYDAVLNSFPNLRQLMLTAQANARKYGYVETILGRRRHIPEMQLPEFEFVPTDKYVNPDVDPLDPSTLVNADRIPDRIIQELQAEFKSYKYFGQIVKRTKELAEQHIKVVNNRSKIAKGSRQTVNSIIQGSAADQTKLAILLLERNPQWLRLGGKFVLPVHDELIAEVPIQNWEAGGKVLSETMCKAAEFLPFPSKCDVTTTFRWYGLEYPCPYIKPKTFPTEDPDEIKWVQYMLIEREYAMPIVKHDDGSDLRGDEALGVNGLITPEYLSAVSDYCQNKRITSDQFVDCIENDVVNGN